MKETHYKLRHRVTVLIAAAVMLCSMLPGAAFAEETEPQPTEEVVQMEQQTEPSETDNGQADESSPDPGAEEEATPKTAEEQPAEEEISAAVVGAELYADLPDAPIGSYIGSEGLPVATGHTKIGISEWPESQLEEISGSYLTADALDSDGLTMTAPLLDGADYAVVPIMAQVEYPADGSSTDIILPDGVTVLDFYGAPAADADTLLHSSYYETSAAVMGLYVQAADDFSAQLVYTDPNGDMQTKTLNVTIDREHTVASPFADAGIAAYGERPIPDVTNGKITKVAKVNGTWLIWFNGDEAYCCTPGADGQPKNCPTYTYVDTSMVGADQYVPGDHYGNQFRIWGGLTQLSLGMQELPPVALSAEAPSLLDFCRTIYTDAQMQIIENYPDSTAAKILMGSAQALLEGTDAYASARGYYTYIYQPGRAGWQTVAVIGPEISDDEPNPKPIVQEIYANWQAPAQTASGSFDFNYGIITDKVQLKTNEKVDGATIEIEPITKSGTIDGGTWAISPADKQTVTTSGHTDDNNYQNNGGAASASWTLHYSVSKTTDSRSGRVGPYTTQDEADAAADSARDSAIAELQGEAQRMVDNAMASAKAELASIKFRYEEVGVPYGFEMYWGSNGSKQTISVPANSNNAYQMKNDEWSLQVNVKKTDSETGNQIAADAQYEIFQWDVVTGKYQPTGGYNTYSIQRQNNGTYAVINSAAYATTDSMRHTLYYVRFLGRIERDGFGDRLRLLPFLLFNKRAYKRNVFSAEDGKALPVLKSHIAQRYFIRAEIYAVNDKLPSVNLQLHANGDILLGIGLVDNIIAVGFIWLRKHEAVSMLQQPLCGACPLSKIIAGHSGFAHTGNIALQQAAIQSAGGSFCIRAIKKQPFSDADTDELFGMLCTKCLICRNIRRKLTTLICNSCEDSRNRFGSVFRIVIALAGG